MFDNDEKKLFFSFFFPPGRHDAAKLVAQSLWKSNMGKPRRFTQTMSHP
jgi:hypothetical protein